VTIKPLTGMTAASSLTGAELFYAQQSGIDVKVTANQLAGIAGVNAVAFGAVPDAVMTVNYGATTQAITGTDSTSAIQAAIDYALQNHIHTVFLPDGNYKITDTLHLGWGNAFYSISLCAMSNNRAPGSQGLAGVNIYSTKFDRPVVNIQGAIGATIRGISFWGLNYVWIYNNRETPHSFLASPASWLDTAITPAGSSPGGIQPHSPYAAITVDAYKGTQPTDHYPNLTFPGWTGLSSQYNAQISTDILIDNCSFVGFGAAVVISPNGGNNGDAVKVTYPVITECVYGVAVGSGQSRNVEIRNANYASLHTLISTTTFGDQTGTLGGTVDNCSGGQGYQLFSLEVGELPQLFTNCYFESQVRIGELIGADTFAGTLTFESCTFRIDDATSLVLPPGLISDQSYQTSIVFRNTRIQQCSRIPNLIYGPGQADITFEGGDLQTNPAFISGSSGGSLAYSRAVNFTGGILFGGGTPAPLPTNSTPTIHATPSQTRVQWINLTTPFAQNENVMAKDLRFIPFGPSRAPLTQFTEEYIDLNGVRWNFAIQQQRVLNLPSMPVLPAFSSDVLTFEYTAATAALWPAHVGDILYHQNTGTIFVITVIGSPDGAHAGALPITAKQMNNMTITTGTLAFATQTCSDLTLAGKTFLINCSIDCPQKVEFGTFTSGSTSVTSVSQGNGDGSDITTYYSTGDNFFGYDWSDTYLNWPVKVGQTIATITNGSPGSMTLSSNALASGRFPIYPIPIR